MEGRAQRYTPRQDATPSPAVRRSNLGKRRRGIDEDDEDNDYDAPSSPLVTTGDGCVALYPYSRAAYTYPQAHNKTCEVCGEDGTSGQEVLCPACPRTYHLQCLQSAHGMHTMTQENGWACPECCFDMLLRDVERVLAVRVDEDATNGPAQVGGVVVCV